MLLRFVLVATLAVGVLGRTTFSKFDDEYAPGYEATQLYGVTLYCQEIYAEDKLPEVTSSIETFAKCMNDLFDGKTLERDIIEAMINGTYDIIRKYCPKAPPLKDCARNLVKGATRCLSTEVASRLIIPHTLIYFACENDGARITSLVQDGGHQCIQENKHGIELCQNEAYSKYLNYMSNGKALADKESEERCIFFDHFFTCTANLLKGCSTPTPGKIVQEYRDGYLEIMACSEESGVTKVVGAKVAVPQTLPASAVNQEMEQLKKKKLELEIRIAELEMWNRENQLHVLHTDLTSDIKSSL